MTALTAERATPERENKTLNLTIATGAARIYSGGIVLMNATGRAIPGATVANTVAAGVALRSATYTAGDRTIEVGKGTFRFANSGDITVNHIGDLCFVVDDQTVSISDGAATRSPAGVIDDVDAQGVWVRFDPALTLAAAAAYA